MMYAIRSILLHLDSLERCAERVRLAAQLAVAFDAELHGLYAVVPSVLRYPLGPQGPAGALGLQNYDQECRRKAGSLLANVCAAFDRLRWEVTPSGSIREFEHCTFYADLLVLGQRDKDVALAMETPAEFVVRQIVHSGRPALVVPSGGDFPHVGRAVLIAWKATPEAARAVDAALPWLCKAGEVHAISYGEGAAESLERLQNYLLDHRVRINLHLGNVRAIDVGEDLLSRATDIGADMLVMGCYGHGRAREWVLGGVSRTVLNSMTVPVLLAH